MDEQGTTAQTRTPSAAAGGPGGTRRRLGVDRAVVLILLLGAAILAMVLLVLNSTLASERDHTRAALIAQQVGRALSTASIELHANAATGTVAAGPEAIARRVAEAEQLLRGDGASAGLGRIEDEELRERTGDLAAGIARWRADLPAALRPDASPAQREAVAAEADALRRRNAATVELVKQRIADHDATIAAIKWGLAAMLALLFGLLAWQVTRNRRRLREANEALRARVEERTAQLARSEARVRVVIESSLDAVVVLDGEGIVRQLNPRAEELFRVDSADLVGLPAVEEAMSPKLLAHQRAAARAYAETGDPSAYDGRLEDVVTLADGTRIPIEVSASAALTGEELTISYFVRDIAERKRARAEIEAARDAAERAAIAKSSFLATMSHEIRTPMNAIVGMTSLLLDSPLDREQQQYVDTVRTSGEQLLAIINDILDFSKIESGKLDLEQHPFALREVIESALDLLAPQAAAKDVDLGYLLETDGSTQLIGDSTRLRQVLINFLSNAVKFTREGSVTIHGRLTDAAADRARLRLEVRDTGIGIPADRIDRLFESFSQVDASTTRKFGGTGLGLAISRRLVEAMGGTVEVSSEEGRGSTFALSVELDRLPGPDPVASEVPEMLQGCRALVVDDNEVNRTLLERQLAGWGVESLACERPADAIALVRGGEWFDVAVVDMQMPEMDGLSLADVLTEATGFTLPVVLLSSIGGVDPALARGRLAATLSKPVKPAILRNALAVALTGAAASPSALDTPVSSALPKHRLRVLVAEDNLVNQQVALATLERLGHLADVAADGVEAVDAVHRQAYDLVLMDVQMPNLDGLEATRRIRAELPDARQPRIVAMTANAFTEDREACIAAGMDDFLTKPVPRDELVRVLSGTPPSPARAGAAAGSAADGTVAQLQETPPLVVDPERLGEATGGDGELAAMLIDVHEQEGTALLGRLRLALAEGDLDALRGAAHTLKSASASVGAMLLSALAADLEDEARAGAVDDPEGQVDRIVEVFGHTHVELQRLRDRG